MTKLPTIIRREGYSRARLITAGIAGAILGFATAAVLAIARHEQDFPGVLRRPFVDPEPEPEPADPVDEILFEDEDTQS